MKKRNIVGYQIVSADGNNDLPNCFYSFEMFDDFNLAELWLQYEANTPEHGSFRWCLIPVFDGDIEDPTIIVSL